MTNIVIIMTRVFNDGGDNAPKDLTLNKVKDTLNRSHRYSLRSFKTSQCKQKLRIMFWLLSSSMAYLIQANR